jgi:hypothetical protein
VGIEGFRNLNQDIETIINKSGAVKRAKKEANDKELSAKKKEELTKGGKGIQEPAKTDSEKAYQICDAHTSVHVFN